MNSDPLGSVLDHTPLLRQRNTSQPAMSAEGNDRGIMDVAVPMALAQAGVSMSLADVDWSKTGKKEGTQFTMMGLATLVIVGGVYLFYLMSFVITSGTMVRVAGAIAFLITPYVLYQRYSLSKQATLRQVHNDLRTEVNRLQEENNNLDVKVTDLESQAERVQHAEASLESIVGKQGSSVADFVDLVKQNGIVQGKIEEALLVDVMQNILTTVIRADVDRNFQITEDEIQMLMIRLNGLPQVDSVDEAQFRRLIAESGNGIHAIVKIVQNVERAPAQSRFVRVSSRHLVF